jgi:hypothetical protein
MCMILKRASSYNSPHCENINTRNSMEYLIKNSALLEKVHVWNRKVNDTNCRMYSTTTMNRGRFSLHRDTKGKAVCAKCLNVK